MTPPRYATSDDAERAFYAAFQCADLEAMMAVWADDPSVVCIHPGGARLTGRDAVRRSWHAIFSSAGTLKLRVTNRWIARNDSLAVHVVHEHFQRGDPRRPIVATNVYLRTGAGWRLIMHHASATSSTRGRNGPTVH